MLSLGQSDNIECSLKKNLHILWGSSNEALCCDKNAMSIMSHARNISFQIVEELPWQFQSV
jgi:hypothetical protein